MTVAPASRSGVFPGKVPFFVSRDSNRSMRLTVGRQRAVLVKANRDDQPLREPPFFPLSCSSGSFSHFFNSRRTSARFPSFLQFRRFFPNPTPRHPDPAILTCIAFRRVGEDTLNWSILFVGIVGWGWGGGGMVLGCVKEEL